MSVLTLADIQRQTRELVGDLGINTDTWTDDQVTEGINWACNEIARKTACTYKETPSITVTANVATIPVLSIRVIRVKDSTGRLLDKTHHAFEALKDPSWESSTSTVNPSWYQMSGSTIRLVRTVTATVTMGFVERPSILALGQQVVDTRIYEYYHPVIKYGAANWLFQTDGDQQDIQKADKFLTEFNSLIGAGAQPVSEDSIKE